MRMHPYVRGAGRFGLLPLICLAVRTADAGSATWNASTDFISWEFASNWLPKTIPDAPEDVATFGSFGTPSTGIGSPHNINSIVFEPGAAAFTIFVNTSDFEVSGTGLMNNSGIIQKLQVNLIGFSDGGGFPNVFYLKGNATAGNLTQITTVGGFSESFGGILDFEDDSTAGTAAIYNLGSDYTNQGATLFYGSASAAQATITNQPGMFFAGGSCAFYENSTAAGAIIINNAAADSNGAGGTIDFSDSSTAADSTIVCNGNPAGSYYPAEVAFHDDSSGGTARIMVFGDGRLAIGTHNLPGVTIGSLEGNGIVELTFFSDAPLVTLSVGSNNRSTTFAGVIQDRNLQSGGSLSKVGTGSLTLTNANTYSGDTTVEAGTLLINNTSGSGTGSSPVRVNGGILGGNGIIGGAVVVGTGDASGAVIGPGANSVLPGTLTIQKKVMLNSDATYRVTLNSDTPAADKLTARGARIRHAQIIVSDGGGTVLAPGTAFTVLNNTGRTPISGTFGNLADGGTIVAGSNTFQASYEGDDGNDLTLTVVP